MVSLASFVAALGFIVPIIAVLVLFARRDRQLWEMGLDIPVAISIDLLIVLGLSRFLPLEAATLLSRAGYVVGTAAHLIARFRRGRPMPAWPATLDGRKIVLLTTATLVAMALSAVVSRTYSVWDRRWHIPLVASLRGQAIPFRNAFDPRQVLHYHFSGDAQAAMLQSLSGDVLHSALALSLAHDIHFALTGLTLAFFLAEWGYRRICAFAAGPLLLLLGGPATLLRGGDRSAQQGYSVINLVSISFRPHVALAGLLILGFVGAIVARLKNRNDLDWRKTAPALCACTAGLSVTDEASLGLLGLTLGVTWLFAPEIIHPARKVGVFVFAALFAALVLPNLAFAATLSPGGEPHTFAIAPWRSPGCYTPTLPLTDPKGRLMLIYDMLPPAAIGAGALLHGLTRRGHGRGVLVAFFTVLLTLSLLALTRLDVDKSALETHRFVTSVFFVAPLVGLALLARRDPEAAPATRASPYATSLIGVGMALAALSTLDWLVYIAPKKLGTHIHYFADFNHYATNCRAEVGGTLGARAHLTYLSKPIWYLYAGCRPVFSPGVAAGSAWKTITIGNPLFGADALAAIRKQTNAGASIRVVCPAQRTPSDAICEAAEANGSCHDLGPHIRECALTAAEAATLAP